MHSRFILSVYVCYKDCEALELDLREERNKRARIEQENSKLVKFLATMQQQPSDEKNVNAGHAAGDSKEQEWM